MAIELFPLILTYGAMALYLITFFLMWVIVKRTRGRFKTTLIIFSAIIIISFIRRMLNIFNLSEILNNEIWDDLFSVVVAALWIFAIYVLFKEIRELTDVGLHHTKEARRERNYPPPRRELGEAFERHHEDKIEEKNIRIDNDGKRRLRVINGYVDFTNE